MSFTSTPAVPPAMRCPYCRCSELVERGAAVACPACGLEFRRLHGVINTLVRLDPEVRREIDGMIREREACGERFERIEDFIVARVEHVSNAAEREAWNADAPMQYYLSTRMNLEAAVAGLDLTGRRRALEIGAENPFEPLQYLRQHGLDEAYALNLRYLYDSDAGIGSWPVAITGDMNRPPFRDGYFDVVLASATTHHSPDLDGLLGEIHRVLAPGGFAILINDPTNGLIKHTWDRISAVWNGWNWNDPPREELIHENEYGALHYRRLFRKHGFLLRRSFFSAYYDARLRRGDFQGVRWAPLAKLFAAIWRLPGAAAFLKRVGLLPGQLILGLEHNVVIEKAR